MGMRHGLRDHAKQAEAAGQRQLGFGAKLQQWTPFDVLHDEVRPPVVQRSAIQHAGDVRVSEKGEKLSFVAELLKQIIRRHAFADDLDRDLLLVRSVVAHSKIDLAHAAAPQFLQHAVRTDRFGSRFFLWRAG